jgi:hypothetical protein
MTLKKLNEELITLKIMYEDAILRKAPADELKFILQKIDEVSRKIADLTKDRLH